MNQTKHGSHEDSDKWRRPPSRCPVIIPHIAADCEPGDAFDQAYGTLYHNKSGWHDLVSLKNGASWAFHKSLIEQ